MNYIIILFLLGIILQGMIFTIPKESNAFNKHYL